MFLQLLSELGLVATFQTKKCKRLLNITLERIKLLEKRRRARLRQLHGDVIKLLRLGKEHQLQPLLERIWKEQCLFSVYIKIAEYCQFVQRNLKDIAGQRECPSGLEEPIAGLCFAASCRADLPELQELREIFAMKYGKKFVNSGQELLPSCHINQQFLEHLCAAEPSETQKQALLQEITAHDTAKLDHEQDTQHQEICALLSTEGFADANICNPPLERIDEAMKSADQMKKEDVVCESVHWIKRGHRRRRFWLNKVAAEEQDGSEEHAETPDNVHDMSVDDEGSNDTGRRSANGNHGCGAQAITALMTEDVIPANTDQRMLLYVEECSSSQPPQRPPPPPPPPKRTPPALPLLPDLKRKPPALLPPAPPRRPPPPPPSPPPKRAPPLPPITQRISMPNSQNEANICPHKSTLLDSRKQLLSGNQLHL